MNCMEFRRMLLTDPCSTDAAFIEHRTSCPECADAVARSAHFERRLRAAVNVDVPENLASRILLKQSFESHRERPWWRSRSLYALAASMLLAVGVAVLGYQSYHEQRSLGEEFVALVNGAPYSFAATGPVSGSEISSALEATGLDLEGSIGDVTFAGRCLVREKLSGHIVVKGETAPVTVFLMADQLVERRTTIRTANFSGIVLPQGSGTIAIVSAPGETLDGVEARVRSALRFKAVKGA
jgi:hypothetical protein